MNKVITILLALYCSTSFAVTINEVFEYEYGAWLLPEEGNIKRWIVIHNLESAKEDGLFHIEVLGRAKEDEPWQVKRIKRHMAVTPEALVINLVEPTKGKVHPDQYIGEYRAWLKSEEKFICQTSILECAK
jgi:uncharacterized protein DUF5086